jgi:hypothetical protein
VSHRLKINETGTDNSINNHEKTIQTGAKNETKSIKIEFATRMRFGTVRGGALKAKRHKPGKCLGPVLGAISPQNRKNAIQKNIQTSM